MKVLLSDKRFFSLLKRYCYEIIKVLMDKRMNFSIVCNVACVKFEPPLPSQIYDTFSDLTVFILAGYTFESLELEENNLYFEAGFGEDNLGSFVTVPLESIVQILLPDDENFRSDLCLYINLLGTLLEPKNAKSNEEEGINSSMKALLSNPENSKFKK
ncbi:hypothetical protein [Helicobacter mesocricetorum]|uniref:hypothetical protein n=1 Tax=Helicobacter mesocricetorum TaxID=87012 RepID=UPI0018F80438|nr:hypothetical protein [Helicobacter mesocricetorum]